MNINQMIEKAVERNIVVYDGDAKSERFTARLFALMSVIGRRNSGNKKTKITNILISSEDETKISEDLAANEYLFFRYGVKFIENDLTKYYLSLQGSLQPGKSSVLLATYNNGDVLLGMF